SAWLHRPAWRPGRERSAQVARERAPPRGDRQESRVVYALGLVPAPRRDYAGRSGFNRVRRQHAHSLTELVSRRKTKCGSSSIRLPGPFSADTAQLAKL